MTTAIDYFLRPETDISVADLRERLASRKIKTVLVEASEVEIATGEDRMVRFKAKEGRSSKQYEIPLSDPTMGHLAEWLQIPMPFLRRQDSDFQGLVLSTLMARKPGDVLVEFTEDAIKEIRPPSLEKIDPLAIIDVAARVVGDDAQVIDGWREVGEYRFDVVVADGASYGIGGDVQVGDLTKGGLRFGQNTKQRLAPWVQQFLYRNICTNGMEIPDVGLAVSLKGNTVPELLVELEAQARIAFDEVEHQISSFYDLRSRKVGDASQMVTRIAMERGLSARVVAELHERLPALVGDTTDSTMFDVVNAVTNMGNHPDILHRPERRRKLELAGGAIIGEHASRCPRCQGKLV